MSELFNLIDGQLNVDVEQPWKIENDSQADWWIERNLEEQKYDDRLEKQIEEKMNFYQSQLKAVKNRKEQRTENMNSKLIEYFESIPDDQKKKTKTLIKYQLPTGTLQKKFKAPTYIKNDEELLKYAETNAPDYIETKKSLKWGDFKKQTKIVDGQVVDVNTGEILPIRLEEQVPVFEVKL